MNNDERFHSWLETPFGNSTAKKIGRTFAEEIFLAGAMWSSSPLPTGTESRVCQDIATRQQAGINKYGVTVEDNQLGLREWLQHAYEECLDQAVYLKRAIEEMDAKASALDASTITVHVRRQGSVVRRLGE